MKIKLCVLLLVFTVSVWVLGFAREWTLKDEAPEPESYEWEISTPEEQGLHSNVVSTALKAAEKISFLHSLLVVRNGYLIAEGYFHGYGKYDARNIHSASKSLMAVLIGIALRENYLSSLEQKLMDFFPEYATPGMDPRKYDITIRHLLTMTCGLGAYEGDNGLMTLRASNPMKAAIEQPLIETPGEKWRYYNPAPHLLRGIIKKTTGMSSYEFARKYLFNPMQISVDYWGQDPQGYYTGEMYFTPGNMARLGHFCILDGLLDGKQILPTGWMEESVESYNKPTFTAGLNQEAYGYLWWVGQLSDYDVYAAMGWGGQYIICIPEINMVVVTTADPYVDLILLTENEIALIQFLEHYILAAARGVLGEPPYFPKDFEGRRLKNQSLFQSEYIDLLTWKPNSRNNGLNITKYRIYRLLWGKKELVAEVDYTLQAYEYHFRGVSKYQEYIYGISAVTVDNKESSMARVIIKSPQ